MINRQRIQQHKLHKISTSHIVKDVAKQLRRSVMPVKEKRHQRNKLRSSNGHLTPRMTVVYQGWILGELATA